MCLKTKIPCPCYYNKHSINGIISSVEMQFEISTLKQYPRGKQENQTYISGCYSPKQKKI